MFGRIILVFLIGLGLLFGASSSYQPLLAFAPKLQLSEYGFFSGALAELKPGNGVFPYEVNAPLFSDYAEKARFIYLPTGTHMQYRDKQPFEFPEGAVIIKNFYYYHAAAHPEQGKRIIETRLLVKTANAWKALDYVWNAEQTEASLEVAGGQCPINWEDKQGKKQSLAYQIPNLNQCKSCHSNDGAFTPIGITARQLNRVPQNEDIAENQLILWQKKGWLQLPADFNLTSAPQLQDYRTSIGTVQDKARAYLDANCAHCHNPHGPASTSGLFLEADQQDLEHLGVLKSPVAAGRGSGKYLYDIVPGKPNESILVYRMESDDPGIRMPEIGRQLEHKEGIELIKAWIKGM